MSLIASLQEPNPKKLPLQPTSQQNPPGPIHPSPNHLKQENLPPTKPNTMVVENEPSKYTYPMKITKPFERDTWTVSTDHCYARPWDWRPESTFLKPSKTLFVTKNIGAKPLFSTNTSPRATDEIIDIESDVDASGPIYDVEKARDLMDECHKYASLARNSIDDENWEGKINKLNWTQSQHKLFNGFINVLNSFYLGKMVHFGMKNEPVLRRTVIDKAVQRVRRLFNTVLYDVKLLQWIHLLLLDNLDKQNLSLYLDILQTLRSKIPRIVDKILNTPSSSNRMGPLNNENLLPLLKKRWDPVESSLMQDKPKKLPSNPILVLMPCSINMTKRNQKWMNLLSNLGQVVPVVTNFGSASHRMTMTNCLDQMFSLTRGRIQDVRENYPGRHIILVGIGAGATLALQVAQVENVFCVISLGFSMLTAEGKRGEPDDNLLELQCPILFVIGQCSSTAFQEDMEDLRERMRIETGLIIVGSADNNLIVSKKKKREEGITQSIVDRCIIDEIGEFIGSLILSPYPPQKRQSPTNISTDVTPKKMKMERKRYNSNASSVESQPPSPTPRITRPVGRPAGKTKCKLESKWSAQVAQGTSSTTATSNPVTSLTALSPSSAKLNNSDLVTTPNSSSGTISATESSPSPDNDTSQKVEEVQIRKVRTIISTEKVGQKTTTGEQRGTEQARMQAYALGRSTIPGGQLSALLQSGIKTIPPVQKPATVSASSIKVLENIQVTSQTSAKIMSNATGRTFDLSKIGLGRSNSGSNVILLPDGKLKTITPSRPMTVKSTSNASTPILLSMNGKGSIKRTKLIPTKRLQNSPVKQQQQQQHTLLPLQQPIKTNLPPPTNLTSQDIMDLPIIFADDNQILESSNVSTDLTTLTQPTPPKFIPPTNKYVLVNRPTSASGLSNFILTPTTVKRPNPVPVTKQPSKYTKIILTKKSIEPLTGNSTILSGKMSNLPVMEPVDLEKEIIATAVPKPNILGAKTMGVFSKKGSFDLNDQMCVDDDDPDYVPPKTLKL